jgi:hypothetical protein
VLAAWRADQGKAGAVRIHVYQSVIVNLPLQIPAIIHVLLSTAPTPSDRLRY